jgi:hypothetical protein
MSAIRRSDLEGAVREGILSAVQADRLAVYLAGQGIIAASKR